MRKILVDYASLQLPVVPENMKLQDIQPRGLRSNIETKTDDRLKSLQKYLKP